MRIGILGYGTIAHEHARVLSGLGCCLAAVAGPSLESATAFAKQHGVERATTDVSDVVGAGDIDAIVVASPNAVHTEQVITSLEHGKHVLCEVPLALSREDANRAAQASRDSESHVMVCQTQRFLRPLELIGSQIPSGSIRQIVIRLVLNRTTNVGIAGRVRSWTDDLVWHHGSHAVDSALWLLDDGLADVTALGAGDNGEGLPMDVGVVLRTTTGSVATIALSYSASGPSTDFMVISQDGTYRYEGGSLSCGERRVENFDETAVFTEAVQRQDAAFVNGVAAGIPASPKATDLGDVYKALQAVTDQVKQPPERMSFIR